MKTSSLREIKKELETLHPTQLLNICIQLVKYKKENKELISYLLFESNDEKNYIDEIKKEIDEQFDEIKKSNSYIAKKQIRKSLRMMNKLIKFSGNKQTEIELRLHFCRKLSRLSQNYLRQSAIASILIKQVQVIQKVIYTLHEDLQFDYNEELKTLIEN